MQDPLVFYKTQLSKLKIAIKEDKKILNLLSFLRLLIFIGTGVLLYFFFNSSRTAIVIAIIGLIIFLSLLKTYIKRKTNYELHKELRAINEEEIQIAEGNYLDRDEGSEFVDTKHFFSSDIDLFGKGSLFQYINRTGLKEGSEKLAGLFTSNCITEIEARQDAIQELAKMPEWRQKYTAIARMLNSRTSNATITTWLRDYQTFIPFYFKWIQLFFSIVSLALFTALFFRFIGFIPLLIWFLAGMLFTGYFVKRVSKLSTNTNRIKETVQQYALLLHQIEVTAFQSILLQKEKVTIESEKHKASEIFKIFSNHLDALDNRNNIFVAFLGNGFFLWDIYCTLNIENWIVTNKDLVSQWFKTVAFFDSFNSLATFAYNHPTFTYPSIVKDAQQQINAKSLGHPLIKQEQRITSDVIFDNSDFFIVTGANMAGKSTFLRTISFYIVMANTGLPVCANESSYKPIKLITSMRTTDSLTDNSSYFFAELTRLQFVIEHLKEGNYLVILDEILKGTNSVDKAEGSKKLIEKLVKLNVSGIIATHDLSLCEIADDLKEVKNFFFETEIKNDELYFDYLLKQGVCKNMNASFLLKKMEIT